MKITESILRKIIREAIENMSFPKENPLQMKFITYGLGDEMDSSKIQDNITNELSFSNNKPWGGLWGAPLNSNGGSPWGEFIQSEMPSWTNKLSTHFIFTLKPDAKIFVINNREDVEKLPWIKDESYGRVAVDWAKVQEIGYDGVYLSTKGNYNLHDTYNLDFPTFNFWDLASICVFNKKVINIEREDIYDYDKNAGKYEDMSNIPSWSDAETKDFKDIQIDKMYRRYGNLNTEPDMSKFFKGKHPGIVSQGDDEESEKMKNFKGTLR